MDSYHESLLKLMHSLLFCFLIVLASIAAPSLADPPYELCSLDGNYAINGTFEKNLISLLSYMSSNSSASRFYSTSFGDGTDRVYAQYMCLNYVTNGTCGDCIRLASQHIRSLCPNDTEAIVWEESCQLRYSSRDFFGRLDISGNKWLDNAKNISQPVRFRMIVNNTLQNLTRVAASGPDKYVTGKVNFKDTSKNTLYGLVQCGRDLSAGDCRTCLEAAISDVLKNVYFSVGARLLSRSCYLRYELYAFYEGATEPASNQAAASGRGNKVVLILIITVALAAMVLVLVASFLYYLRRYHRDKKAYDQDLPFMSLRIIASATKNFSSSNKLGQGGFGPVYKGVLPDGKEVAIKMLSSCSEQGAEEFTNEVLLIMNLQHRNLVKLLGFCVDREERMLVYEFMPNGSLDVMLLDPNRRAKLNWRQRLDIIDGIARGVLYLHEDSQLRIIHRDLKPSNILLDTDMNPKISDFGMARIFAGNDAGANTATIVGTYGYMAPEYAMEGLYSTKSDVFSFGVILLETITGERNTTFHLSKRAPTLLAYAWQLWNEGKGQELVDPLIKDSWWFPEEFNRYMHVGLLCVQEDAYDRPSMSSVVVMLKSESTALRNPDRPAFSVGRFTDQQVASNCGCSINGVTVSSINPR
ncbi:cysteine-rich receptor-like protein kinase 10 [Punica granatum]|uniref:non-specific serine/threonine protein kinase n=1 Tax=Punica granatum TaxID=22663 RepID=A0A6P8DAA8_PUNGR|nr:cysteine-rich receptor-like protein kinase 10 [Punica granatum]